MLRDLVVFLTVCVAAAGLVRAEGPGIAGVVRSGGQPIPGATVTAIQGERRTVTSTDDAGRYAFTGLVPGGCIVEVEMFGFAPALQKVELAGQTAALDWTLELKRFPPPAPPAAAPQPATAARTPEPTPQRSSGSPPQAGGAHGTAVAQTRGPVNGRATAPVNGRANGQNGYRSLTLNENTDTQIQETLDSTHRNDAPPAEAANANEAFLVNGSLSSGLGEVRPEDGFAGRRAEFDQMRGQDAAGRAFGQQGAATGPGGPGGGFGGRGGGPMMGGPGMRGGGGGGRMGGGRPGGFPGRPEGPFGNRARRGRNSLRGAVFFTLANSAFDARPFSLTGQTVEKPSYAQSRFGIVAGGPLVIPKLFSSERTFFFFHYSGTRGRNPFNAVSTLPTALERTGDFSQSLARTPVQIFDPLNNHQPFPGNLIPANRLNPAALGLLPYIPLPNQPGAVQNYQYVTSVGSNTDNLGLRVNRPLTQRDRIDGGLNMQSRSASSAQLYGFNDSADGLGLSFNSGWTRNVTRHILNRLSVTFSRNRNDTLPFFAYGPDVAGALGITGVSRDPINYGPPNLSFTNFGGLTDASPLLRRDQTAGLTESLTFMRTNHTLTLGMGYRRMQLNTRTDQNARGTFAFSGLATSAFDAGNLPLAGTGYDFADFLLGLPQSSSVRFGDTSTYFRASAWNGFVMDDWRLRPNLTLNLGLRYEYFTPFHEKYGHIANLDIAPGFTGVAVVTPGQTGPYTGAFPDGLVDPDKNNFSPRLAVAWRPFPKKQTLLRAGYGIFYNGSIYNQFPARLAAQPPFASTSTLNTSLEQPLTLQNGFATAPTQTILNTYAVDRYYKDGYAQTWNFAVQQGLPHQIVVELGYLGTKGTRLDIQRLPNRAAPGSPLTAEQRRQIGNAVGFTFDSSQGNSIYHAAQVRFTRRFSKGISANALYTFSKSIDNASSLGGGAAVVAQNDNDLRAERGISSFNQRHVLNLFYVLTSPVAESGGLLHGSGWTLRLLRDWTVSGGLTASSGMPLTARVLGNASDTGGTGSVGSGRADATGAPLYEGSGFFNLAAFTLPSAGRFGDAGRNTIDGPARVSLNLSLSRSFRLDDRRRVEFRVDSQNFTNHVSYTSLGTVVNASNYGLPIAAAGMRTVTATLRVRF